MSEILGRVDRPAAESFRSLRKLYLVFLVFTHESAPKEYTEKCERYWSQVGAQLANLEAKAGIAAHIYHEAVYESGDDGLGLLKGVYPFSHALAAARCADGAVLEAFEDRELAAEVSDWERFMMMGYASKTVGELVSDLYTQALKKRNEHVLSIIDSTLGPGQAGILFVGEGHRLQFPPDIEVFSVVPPALDEIHRWLRDQSKRVSAEQAAARATEEDHGPMDAQPAEEV